MDLMRLPLGILATAVLGRPIAADQRPAQHLGTNRVAMAHDAEIPAG